MIEKLLLVLLFHIHTFLLQHLATASEATTAWADGVTSINDWMETVERYGRRGVRYNCRLFLRRIRVGYGLYSSKGSVDERLIMLVIIQT